MNKNENKGEKLKTIYLNLSVQWIFIENHKCKWWKQLAFVFLLFRTCFNYKFKYQLFLLLISLLLNWSNTIIELMINIIIIRDAYKIRQILCESNSPKQFSKKKKKNNMICFNRRLNFKIYGRFSNKLCLLSNPFC